MKHVLFTTILVASFCALLASCGSMRSQAQGLENVAYLQITGDNFTYSKVTVVLDDDVTFEAKVNDNQQRATKNDYTYKIAVGAHDIKVLDGDKVLVSKKIFTSANQVKIVEVP